MALGNGRGRREVALSGDESYGSRLTSGWGKGRAGALLVHVAGARSAKLKRRLRS